MGAKQRHSLVRLDGFRHFGRPWDHTTAKDAADTAAGDFLQSFMADDCGVSALVDKPACRLAGRGHDLSFLMGHFADRGRAVDLRLCDLHLQAKDVEAYSGCAVN